MSWPETAAKMVGSQVSPDLLVSGAWAATAAAWALVAGDALRPVTAVLALPLVFILPGYVAVSVAFPEFEESSTREPAGRPTVERTVLAVFLSLLSVLFVALIASFTPWGLGPAPVLFGLGSLTLVGVAAASRERAEGLPDRRSEPLADDLRNRVVNRNGDSESPRSSAVAAVADAFAGDSTWATLLNVVLVVAVAAALASVAQAVVLTDGPGHTETYLLTENESGALVAADYPTNLTAGQSVSPVVGVENHYRQPVEYTVIVQLQRLGGDDDSEVVETQSVARMTRTVGPGERALASPAVTPELTGDRLRLVYLVYAGEPPARPMTANADSEVHLQITIREPEAGFRECATGCP